MTEDTQAAQTDVGGDRSAALAERLRAARQRVTSQRLVILEALEPGAHLSADDVFARVEPLLPAVNRSTVYRTLELFRDLGLISETDLGGGVREFELLDARHHHLICRACGGQIEIDDALVAPLRTALRDRYGFVAGIDHLAIFGMCGYCEREAQGAAGAGERE
ncbi:MAG TPA: transcriptional repressor [Thermomicrobiales bacterium]|nr:transcriptional repressor [Thermomicrobiales bacterium]